MTWRRETGSALVVTLGMLVCLTGLGLGVLTTALSERTIAARMQSASGSASAAGAVVEFAFAELAAVADWSLAIDGTAASVFRDGSLRPDTPARRSVDLDAVRASLQHDTAELYPVGADGPVWRLWAWGPLSRLAGVAPGAARDYVALWVADDPADGDGQPEVDANGTVMLHGEAYGDGGTRRAVDAVIGRAEGAVRVFSWRVS